MVFVVIEPSITLLWEKIVTVPFVTWLPFAFGTEQLEWDCAFKRVYLDSIRQRVNLHLPVAGVCGGMIVAVVHQNRYA